MERANFSGIDLKLQTVLSRSPWKMIEGTDMRGECRRFGSIAFIQCFPRRFARRRSGEWTCGRLAEHHKDFVVRFVRCFRFLAASVLAASLLIGASGAIAGAWPNRAIKLVVPFPPGGAADTVARVYADKMTEALKQPVVIENKAGAGTAIAAEVVASADPDGYTLSLAPAGQLTILPHINKEIRYDPFKSFAPVSNLATVPYVLAASPDTPVSNAKEARRRGKEGSRQVDLFVLRSRNALPPEWRTFREPDRHESPACAV
jgi:Tripartite tricarboxylate transporter family receptor